MNDEQLKIVINAVNNTKGVFTQVSSQLKTVSSKITEVGRKTTQAGRSLAPLSLAFTAVAGIGVRAFAKLDKALTESTAIMGKVTDETREKMKKLAEEMSIKFPFAADKVAEAYFFLASAGLDAKQSMAALPAVMNFATAGAFDLSQATDLLTDAQSALGLTVDDSSENMKNMVRVSDALVKANTLANASVIQFSQALTGGAAAVIRSYNLELNNSVAVLAAYADQGIKGAEAGNMFGRMTRLLVKSAIDNKEAFRDMGISVFDAGGNLRDFAEITGDMEKAFAGMGAEQKAIALELLGFQALSQKAILPLIGMSEKIREYDKALSDAGGTTQEVSDKQLKSFTNQMITTWNQIKVLVGSIMEQLAPALAAVAEKIKSVTKRFNELSPQTKKIIGIVVLLVAGLVPLLLIVGQIVIAVAALIPVIGFLGASFIALAANPIVAIIAALALVSLELTKLTTNFDVNISKIKKEVKSLEENLSETFKQTVEEHLILANNIVQIERQLIDARKAGMDEVVVAKQKELNTLLSLEKQGAKDRIAVLTAEFNVRQQKRGELMRTIKELEERNAGILGILGRKDRTKKIAELQRQVKGLAGQAIAAANAINQIEQVGQQQELEKIFEERGGVPDIKVEGLEPVAEKNKIIQEAQKETAEVTEEMVDDMTTGYNNLENKVGDSVDFLVKKNEQLRAELEKFKALTAPTEGADRRTFQDVVNQAGVPDPTSGGVFTPRNPDFNEQYPDRALSRIQDNVREGANPLSPVINFINTTIDSDQRRRDLIEGLKLALGRSYKQVSLGSS